jgi:hypothetical protein
MVWWSLQITVAEIAAEDLWPFSNLLLFIYYAVIPASPNEVILHLSQLNHQ